MADQAEVIALPGEPLELGKTLLRAWQPKGSDSEFLHRAWADPEIQRWSRLPQDRSAAAVDRILQRCSQPSADAVDLVIVDPATSIPVGEVSAASIDLIKGQAVVGWWLVEAGRGQGHATRAVNGLCEWLRAEHDVTRFAALAFPENEASIVVARRCGFEPRVMTSDGQRVYERNC